MELADYIRLARKRWAWLVALAALGAALGGGASLLIAPTYSASSQVFVSLRSGDSTSDLVQGSTFTAKQVKSYTELVTSPRVLTPVIEELGLADTPGTLAARLSAELPQDTVLINITAQDESATVAADIANATAVSLASVVAEIEKPESLPESPIQISTVREATVPSAPSSPRTSMNIALGLLVGLGCGVAIVLLREILDTRILTQDDVRAVTDASIIGMVTFDEEAPQHPLIVQESPQSPRAEALRRVRTNLQFLTLDSDRRMLVMTSAIPGEGKSTTSINLAITMADAGSKVLLVDADLRRPSVSKYMGLEGGVGLTTVLIGRIALVDAVQPWGSANLHVLPAGQIPPNPSELLGSEQMAQLLAQMGSRYDAVILDTAPLLPVTDGAVLAKLAGGAVIVVGAGIIHRPQLEEAMQTLATVNAKVLGVVMNRVPSAERSGYGYGAYEYRSDTDEAGPEGASLDGIPRHSRPKRRSVGPAAEEPSAGVGAPVPDPSVTRLATPPGGSPFYPVAARDDESGRTTAVTAGSVPRRTGIDGT